MDAEQKMKALEFFKDWTNYLLVTTVAALGWVSSQSQEVLSGRAKAWCVWLLALSVVCAILTLALIPAIAEKIGDGSTSIYAIYVPYSKLLWWIGPPVSWQMRLRCFCLPQHALFILGVLIYAGATYGARPGTTPSQPAITARREGGTTGKNAPTGGKKPGRKH